MNRRIDPWILLITITMVLFGLTMVYSASAMVAAEWSGDELTYVKRQLIAVAVGSVVCGVSALTPMRTVRQTYRYLCFACLTGLALCYVPFVSNEVNGASRWIGFGSVNIQPSEFAKIIMMFAMADQLHRWRGYLHDVRVVGRVMRWPLLFMALVFFQPDFGTTAIIGGLAALMLFTAGLPWRHISVIGGGAVMIGGPLMVMEPYRVRRLLSFMNPWQSAQGDGYHTIQSWLAMYSGGMWGQGGGNSIAKLHFLPEPWTDYIGAVIAEEYGFSGLLLLIVLYSGMVWRGLYIAGRARDAFSTYIATTITAMIGFEAFFNLGVIMGLLPSTGLVLPFISYGATAMMSHLWAIGILLSIAAEADETPVEAGWPTSILSQKTPQPPQPLQAAEKSSRREQAEQAVSWQK